MAFSFANCRAPINIYFFNLVSKKLCRVRDHSFLGNYVLIPYSLQVRKVFPVLNPHPSCCSLHPGDPSRDVPVESLNIHVLSASSSSGDLVSDSLSRLRRSEWEMGARRRLLLLSCTRVLRALESRTEVCFGSSRGKREKSEGPFAEDPPQERGLGSFADARDPI